MSLVPQRLHLATSSESPPELLLQEGVCSPGSGKEAAGGRWGGLGAWHGTREGRPGEAPGNIVGGKDLRRSNYGLDSLQGGLGDFGLEKREGGQTGARCISQGRGPQAPP